MKMRLTIMVLAGVGCVALLFKAGISQRVGKRLRSDGLPRQTVSVLESYFSESAPASTQVVKATKPPKSSTMLPARLSYLKPLASFDECVPFFFHVPKAGGSTIKALSMEVYRYNSQDPLGTPVAIAAMAEKLRVAPREVRDMVDYVQTPRVYDAADIFDRIGKKACAAALLREPLARVRSIFDYLKYADWEPTYTPEWKNITLDEYVAKGAYEENWMVRMLSNRFEGPLTNDDLEIAKEAISRMIVGFTDNIEAFLPRVHNYWGLTPLSASQNTKLRAFLDHPVNKDAHKRSALSAQSEEILRYTLRFDIELYAYAKNALWNAQSAFDE